MIEKIKKFIRIITILLMTALVIFLIYTVFKYEWKNVCVTCQYYESCNRPERFMKCMGYKEKQERGEVNAQQTGR